MTAAPRTVMIEAPAKINLGLEILGKREDGYHEIRSILAMIDLADTLTLTTTAGTQPRSITGMDLDREENLIAKAVSLIDADVSIAIEKRIPMAAGLGGASADAAATLFAANALTDSPCSSDDLHGFASKLGSDVPFFLDAPCALASGRGTALTPLPVPQGWLVLACPDVTIPGKTSRLYAELRTEDFSNGSMIQEQAARLGQGLPIAPTHLQNAFSSALRRLAPEVAHLQQMMRQAGSPFVALSGAGPAHYTIVPDRNEAIAIATRLQEMAPPDTRIVMTGFRHAGLHLLAVEDTM